MLDLTSSNYASNFSIRDETFLNLVCLLVELSHCLQGLLYGFESLRAGNYESFRLNVVLFCNMVMNYILVLLRGIYRLPKKSYI